VLRRRLQSLAGASAKGALAVGPGIVLKAGTTLVRQWRGHTHTVLVHKDGFEHEGQRYRSLTIIAERITGAHWSGPRFFGLTKRAGASAGAQAAPCRGQPALFPSSCPRQLSRSRYHSRDSRWAAAARSDSREAA